MALASVRPTDATCGSQYVTRGIALSSTNTAGRPASSSATKMPCWKPRCASLEAGDDVAHRVDARHGGLRLGVGDDVSAGGFDPDGRQRLLVGVRAATHCHQQQLGLGRLAVLQPDRDTGLAGLDRRHVGIKLEGDFALAEGALDQLGRVLVVAGEQAGECLDDADLGAERPPDRRELASYDTAAQHDDRLRHPI